MSNYLTPQGLFTLDLEMTSNRVAIGERAYMSMLSLGAVSLSDPNHPFFYAECRKHPFGRIQKPKGSDKGALFYSGFKRKDVYDINKPFPGIVLANLLGWTSTFPEGTGRVAATKNGLDYIALETEADRVDGLDLPRGGFRIMDIHTIAVMWAWQHGKQVPLSDQGTSKLSLEAICTMVDMQIPNGARHNALGDSIIEAEATYRMTTGAAAFFPNYLHTIEGAMENLPQIQARSLSYAQPVMASPGRLVPKAELNL
jgi:hypothetical protein